MLCPKCEADVRGALAVQEEKAWGDAAPPEYEVVRKGFRLAPSRCPACESPLDPTELVLAANDFEDEVPFCHFAVCIQAVREPTVELVYFDPEFLEAVGEACGVPVRSTGRIQ